MVYYTYFRMRFFGSPRSNFTSGILLSASWGVGTLVFSCLTSSPFRPVVFPDPPTVSCPPASAVVSYPMGWQLLSGWDGLSCRHWVLIECDAFVRGVPPHILIGSAYSAGRAPALISHYIVTLLHLPSALACATFLQVVILVLSNPILFYLPFWAFKLFPVFHNFIPPSLYFYYY